MKDTDSDRIARFNDFVRRMNASDPDRVVCLLIHNTNLRSQP